MTVIDNNIIFEYPIEERIRNYIRLESLFERFYRTSELEDHYSHHLALLTLFEIMDCASRSEIKLDILKELERQKQLYIDRLDKLIPILSCIDDLQKIQHKLGHHIRENNWLMSIKQRVVIPGGTSPLDLPSYYVWCKLSANERREYLKNWIATLVPTGNAISLLMKILRDNCISIDCKAINGNYSRDGLEKNIHLLRIETDLSHNMLPEVSANKHVLHIRFVDIDFYNARGKQINFNQSFKLNMCSFKPNNLE
ncbi:MAG: cell division protein ZapD [Neisseriaceae bacterium]|nr:cell division protein ZapD [Neisseriaceae bacterium]